MNTVLHLQSHATSCIGIDPQLHVYVYHSHGNPPTKDLFPYGLYVLGMDELLYHEEYRTRMNKYKKTKGGMDKKKSYARLGDRFSVASSSMMAQEEQYVKKSAFEEWLNSE